jgi:pimeloyl-ACP methyl ester carboxylesterase
MKHLGKAPPFRGPNGEVVPGSIAEIRYLRLGGVDQWVMIRGESPENPLLILLHGGPGFPEMRLFRSFNAPLEKDFTVVYWEQRGTDKSFGRNIPKSSMTVEQFIADLDELVEAMRERFGKKKVAIYGHSWGPALGVLLCGAVPAEGYCLFRCRADWELAGERGYMLRVHAGGSGAPREPQSPSGAWSHRPTSACRPEIDGST